MMVQLAIMTRNSTELIEAKSSPALTSERLFLNFMGKKNNNSKCKYIVGGKVLMDI